MSVFVSLPKKIIVSGSEINIPVEVQNSDLIKYGRVYSSIESLARKAYEAIDAWDKKFDKEKYKQLYKELASIYGFSYNEG